MSEAKMPERWEMPLSCDYRPAANGDWVRAEDVEPLLAEITRLRARVEVLEADLHGIFHGANFKLVPKANAEEAKP